MPTQFTTSYKHTLKPAGTSAPCCTDIHHITPRHTTDGVRLRAATNLGELAGLSPKVDALATNLVTSARSGGPQVGQLL